MRSLNGLGLAMLLMTFSSLSQEITTYACTYTDKINGTLEVLEQCVRAEKESLHFLPALFTKSARQDNGLLWAAVHGQGTLEHGPDYYIKDNGDILPVLNFDNGPDEFSEGVVRSRVNGKTGFFDAQFRQIIARQFDFAWPFEQGKALVCNGCKPQREAGGEHTMMVGGDWFYIDKTGKRISEIQHRPF